MKNYIKMKQSFGFRVLDLKFFCLGSKCIQKHTYQPKGEIHKIYSLSEFMKPFRPKIKYQLQVCKFALLRLFGAIEAKDFD
jgi:hypothetical protein